MPEKKLKIQNFFEVITTGTIPLSGDAVFTVSVAPTNTRGFIVVSPNNLAGREIMFYNSVGNTLTVKAENRGLGGTAVSAHALNEPVALKDVAEIFNFFSDNVSQAFFVEKTGGLNIEVWGGFVNYNGALQEVAGSTFTLADNTINYLKYDYPTNTLSVSTSSGNNKAIITTSSGAITSIVYQIAKESFIDFTVTLNGALPNQTGQQGKVLGSDGANTSWVSKNDYAVDSGTANTYVATIPSFQLSAGSEVAIKITNANTGASTININGTGAKSIKKNVSSDISSGDILAGEIIKLIYDGTNFQMVSDIPAAVASNFKNSDYIAGEALSTGNAVVVEKLDIQDPSIFTYSAGTPVTSTAGLGNNQGGQTANVWEGMRFSVSSTRVFTGGTIINGSTNPTNWRLLNGSNAVIDSGTISGTTLNASGANVILTPGVQYKIEATHTSVTWSPYGGVVSLPVSSGSVTFNYRTVNAADTNPNQVTTINSIDTAPLVETLTAKNIGDITANTRVENTVWGTGISGNTATFQLGRIGTPGNLGVRIETDNAGNPSGTLVDPNATASIIYTGIPTSPASPTIPGSVVTTVVTFAGSFTLALNTKYHIVFFQGTYGSETINPSNYYMISYSGGYVGTQRSKKWNGSTWSSEASVRKYTSSSLFLTNVLAKTNATVASFAYCDGIVESNFSEGQPVTMVTAGRTNSITGLTPRTKYYLSNTPGAIATSAGSTVRAIGTASASGNLDIGFYLTT